MIRKSISLKYETASVGLAAYFQVNMLVVRYESVNFGAEKSLVSPNWRDKVDREREVDMVCQHQGGVRGGFSQRRDLV